MPRKLFVLLLFFMGISSITRAQFYPTQYRPPNQNWQFLQTPHFKLIYAKGNDPTALQMGQILEQQYPLVQQVVGGHLKNFPVILNDYNDRSNGFVTPLHFRSEIELPPIKGKSLNPQTGNWLKNVGPHELIHAMQFSNLGDYNIPRLVNLFSPDMARTFHGVLPSGVLEGIAVYHETENIAPNGGRGNFPIFTNQFNAVFDSDRRWSMGQMTQPPSRTRPFSRHYIGGYEFSSWLQKEYGSNTTQQVLDFYLDFPFLGYGVALRHVTGSWPGQLYNQFEKTHTDSLTNLATASPKNTLLDIPLSGREIRRPKWLSDTKLIFYGSFYNARPGFYSYNLETKNLKRLLTTNSVGDYRYDLSPNHSQMVFSYYEANAIYDNTSKVELVKYDFSTDESRQITKDGRTYAPFFMGHSLLALQTRPASSRLVSISDSSVLSQKIKEVVSLGENEIISVDYNPKSNKLAVVINKEGAQALWITDPQALPEQLQRKPDILFSSGSIFDPEWHPNGQKLMFSSDFSGSQQLYEYDLANDSVSEITNAPYNAFEGSYSPGGDRIAYIRQVKNEWLPAIIKRSNFENRAVSKSAWQPTESKMSRMQQPVVSDSMVAQSKNWETGRYTPGVSWLAPRSVFPVLEEVGNQNVYKGGFSIHSNSTLSDQSYSAAFSYFEDRGWYDLSYQNKSFFPGFKVRLFSKPSYRSISNMIPLLRQEQSLALSIPFQVRLNQNIYNTSFFVEPEIRRSQIRFFETGGSNASDFTSATIGNIYSQFNYRLQKNIRDLQPNTGFIFYAETEYISDGNDVSFSTAGTNISISADGGSAVRGGIFGYLSPLRRWNQSLRIGIQGLKQTGPIFDNQSVVSDAFSETIFPGSDNLLSFSTRYTIPISYVDDGGLLIPFYLSTVYLVAFTNTVTDTGFRDWYKESRSVFGLGIRAQFRFGNISVDLGLGYGFEPTRKKSQFFIGEF